ncbi:MAG: FtsX-like permease family protein [Candidatus Dojkabacteria bacterium]|nr:MAG: FtsX-like permease family protein [Candidatus Dojkabacteria bacterium]
MKIKDIFIKSNRHIVQSKTRSLLTILAVAVGGTTLTLALGAGIGVITLFNRELNNVEAEGSLSVFPGGDFANEREPGATGLEEYEEPEEQANVSAGGIPILNQDDRSYFESLDGVDSVYYNYSTEVQYVEIEDVEGKYQTNTTLFYPDLKLQLLAGRLPEDDDETVVTEEYLETAELDKHDPEEVERLVGKSITISYLDSSGVIVSDELEIVGVKSTGITDTEAFYITEVKALEIQTEQLGAENPLLASAQTAVLVLEDTTAETEKKVTDELNKEGYQYFNFAQLNQLAQSAGVYITSGLVGFSSIVIFASLFGILNTMLMSVYERTKEIGLMKAIGMSNRTVFALFSIEGAFIGFWGGVVGIVSALIVGGLIFNPLLFNYFESQGVDEPIQFLFPPLMLIPIVLFLTSISLIAALIPARKASRLDPIEALRYE